MVMRSMRIGVAMLFLAAMLIGIPTVSLAADAAASISTDDSPIVDVDPSRRGKGGGTDVILHPKDPAEDGGSGGGGEPPGKRTDVKRRCEFMGVPIDCSSDLGSWSNKFQCWLRRLDPQPPKTDFRWDGHTDGVLYWCTVPGAGGDANGGNHGNGSRWVWLPGDEEAGFVDLGKLLDEVVEVMHLEAPTIMMTPRGEDRPAVVGVNTWMWIANQGPHGFGPITRSASAGSVTLTATARTEKIVWEMGDGTTITCANPGTEWTASRGTGPSPTCGHRYEQSSLGAPNDRFTVTATAHWQVDWAGAGQTGSLSFTMSRSRQLEVTEVQVLQTS